jgi:hypothetical protein
MQWQVAQAHFTPGEVDGRGVEAMARRSRLAHILPSRAAPGKRRLDLRERDRTAESFVVVNAIASPKIHPSAAIIMSCVARTWQAGAPDQRSGIT